MIKRITLIVLAILSIMFVVEQQDTYKPNYTKLSSDKLLFDDDMEISISLEAIIDAGTDYLKKVGLRFGENETIQPKSIISIKFHLSANNL